MHEPTIVDPSLLVLSKLFAAATQNASVAMGHWTNGQLMLSLDEVHESPVEEIAAELELGTDLMTMIVLAIEGDVGGGQLILTFDDTNGRNLAASLLRRPVNEEPEWSALEKSAVMETGNILGSAYLNELTRLTGHKLVPSAPVFIQDFGASVVEQALMAQAMELDKVLVCQTRFECNQQELDWNVFFVPSNELLHVMREAIHSGN